MALSNKHKPAYANLFTSAKAVMAATPVGAIYDDTNGVDIIKGAGDGTILKTLLAINDDPTTAVDLAIYTLDDDGTLIPIGIVTLPNGCGFSAGVPAFDILNDAAGLVGLPKDNQGLQQLDLKSSEMLKAVPLNNPIGGNVYISAKGRYIET